MHQIAPRLWIGSAADFQQLDQFSTEWAILFAAKLPWHKEFVGYTTNAAPEGPEYYGARRGKRLALNMIDAPKPEFFHPGMIEVALTFIEEQLGSLKDPDQLLICCNQGQSGIMAQTPRAVSLV